MTSGYKLNFLGDFAYFSSFFHFSVLFYAWHHLLIFISTLNWSNFIFPTEFFCWGAKRNEKFSKLQAFKSFHSCKGFSFPFNCCFFHYFGLREKICFSCYLKCQNNCEANAVENMQIIIMMSVFVKLIKIYFSTFVVVNIWALSPYHICHGYS